MPDPVINLEALDANILSAFEKIYAEEMEIEKADAIGYPHKQERTKIWRELKADTTIPRKQMEPYYKIFKQLQEARTSEDENAFDEFQDNMRTMTRSLTKGEVLNWLDVAESADSE